MNRVSARRPSTSMNSSKLARSQPPSVSPNSLDYGLQVRTIMASKCISPNSLGHGLQVHLQTRSIPASKCISEFTRSQSPSAYPNSLNHSLQLHLSVHSISVSKCFSNTLDQVHLQGATAIVRRYRGNGGGQSDGEYIFGRPRST